MTLIVFIGLRFHKRNRQVARAVPNWIFFSSSFQFDHSDAVIGLKDFETRFAKICYQVSVLLFATRGTGSHKN